MIASLLTVVAVLLTMVIFIFVLLAAFSFMYGLCTGLEVENIMDWFNSKGEQLARKLKGEVQK